MVPDGGVEVDHGARPAGGGLRPGTVDLVQVTSPFGQDRVDVALLVEELCEPVVLFLI